MFVPFHANHCTSFLRIMLLRDFLSNETCECQKVPKNHSSVAKRTEVMHKVGIARFFKVNSFIMDFLYIFCVLKSSFDQHLQKKKPQRAQ